MANTFYPTGPLLGTSFSDGELLSDGVLRHPLGTRVEGTEGSVFVYCQANGAITGDGYVVFIDEGFQADMLETTISGTEFGSRVGVAKHAFADNEYGWIQIAGTCDIRVAASAAANTTLNTTATAGQLDDDNLVGSENVDGLILTTANGGSAGNAEGVLNFPTIGAGV